jgi:ATP phosphoribosyltransferase
MIKIAIPNKGRLHEPTINILDRAGLKVVDFGERRLFASTVDPEVQLLFVRALDIPEFVHDGAADLGVTGLDVIMETNYDVELILNLNFGKARLVVAVPDSSSIRSPRDIKSGARVATEFPRLTTEFFKKHGKKVEITKVSGATEIAPHIGIADLIVDLTSTGTTLTVHKLKIIDEIIETSAHLIANKDSLKKFKKKIDGIVLSLKSVLLAERKKLIMMNVPREALEDIKRIMPGMAGPTVSEVAAESPMLAVNVVVDEEDVYSVINEAKKVGARDILVVPIERIVP